MKNIKKSLLVVPALGVLMLAAAGSVGGTVAWFSSVNVFETDVSSFTVTRIDGSLACEMTSGNGTFAPNKTTITVGTTADHNNVLLTHGSYDYTSWSSASSIGNVYIPNSLGSGYVADEDWHYANTVRVGEVDTYYYYAVSWTMTFSYSFGADTAARNLYLNPDSDINYSTVARPAQNNSSMLSYMGFRLAFVRSASDRLVWAPYQPTASNQTFIDGSVSTTAATSMAADDVYYKTETTGVVAVSATSGATTAPNYLGQFTSSTTSLAYTCVAWFEGTDPNIVDDAALHTITASLKFFTCAASGS